MTDRIDPDPPGALNRAYKNLTLQWGPDHATLTVRMRVYPIQCFSLAAISELQQVFNDLTANPGIVRHLVFGSSIPGVFNFGGDLSLFVLLIRARDLESLRLYARRCIDLVWWWESAASLGIHTIALVEGDTLGGGLEAALLHHTVIFDADAQAGFPEILFNLFPGMGGWNLAIRRGNVTVANEMILTGRIFSAEQLFRRGLVDVVASAGQVNEELSQVIKTVEPRFRGTIAALKARRMAAPITFDALQNIVDHWAVTALGLSTRDIRLMERLARAQVRKAGGASKGAIEEIKRMELDTAWDFERTGVSEWATLPST